MPIQHTVVFRLRHQSGSREKTAFTLANGALGRLHLSGFPHLLSTDRKALVSEAVRVHKDLRPFIRTATPSWPLGLAQRDEQWQALALRDRTQTVLTLWHQDGAATDVRVSLPYLRGRDVDLRCSSRPALRRVGNRVVVRGRGPGGDRAGPLPRRAGAATDSAVVLRPDLHGRRAPRIVGG